MTDYKIFVKTKPVTLGGYKMSQTSAQLEVTEKPEDKDPFTKKQKGTKAGEISKRKKF